jgi:hypothetical protein
MHDLSVDPVTAGIRNDLMWRLNKIQSELGDKLNLERPAKEI